MTGLLIAVIVLALLTGSIKDAIEIIIALGLTVLISGMIILFGFKWCPTLPIGHGFTEVYSKCFMSIVAIVAMCGTGD